jgi:hypothetical protein
MVKKDWREASNTAQKKFGKRLTDLISERESGDASAQEKINEAYGVGEKRSLSKEGRSHLDKQLANEGEPVSPKKKKSDTALTRTVIDDYNDVKKAREDKAYGAMKKGLDKFAKPVGEVMGDVETAKRDLDVYAKEDRASRKKKGRKTIAGE